MPIDQVSMRELLEDELFRKWMVKVPPHALGRWRVYVLRDRGWQRGEIDSYHHAYRWMASLLRREDVLDVAVNNPAFPTRQPARRTESGAVERWWPLSLAEDLRHRWCPYCRRPTVFAYFSRHHALRTTTVDVNERRCYVCGCSQSLANKKRRK